VNDRQFLWGLSNGVMVFAIGGAFWLGLGIGLTAPKVGWLVSALGTALQVGICAGLLWGAVRLRRRSGFRSSELRQEGGGRAAETRHIMAGLRWTVAGQTVLIALAVGVCLRADREPLIWPAIALVVSLHLIPLAKVFHVRAYYATAVAGSGVSIVAITALTGLPAVAFLAVGMATVMWGSAVYLVRNADTITARALGERWAV
jgi:hypothetical protein